MKERMLETERMTLRPMSDAEIEAWTERTDSAELRTAYGEMLADCRRDAENRVWYAPWVMERKGNGESLGELGFKGPVQHHAVEIGYSVLPEHEGNGYATEAVLALTAWALGQKGVAFVEAETAPDNKASQRVLEKCGFVPDGTTGEEGPRFVRESVRVSWMPIYTLVGIALGMSFGQMHGQLLWGMTIGLALGALAGAAVESCEKKKREILQQQRRDRDRPI